MKHVLAAQHRSVVEQFARSRVLLGFDFDGTLSPIVREPSAANMRGSTRILLRQVAKRYPCAIISGRSLADVSARLEGIPIVAAIGNHGLEPAKKGKGRTKYVERWMRSLGENLADLSGIEIEDKGLSIAVHYRKTRARRVARERVARAIESLEGAARIIPGKLVVNILPPGAVHKGTSLQELRARVQADTAIYVGDDVTDEDVFSLDEPGRLLSIRVGRDSSSSAEYYLRSQREMDLLLKLLTECRPIEKMGNARA